MQPSFAVCVSQNPMQNLGVFAERQVVKLQHCYTRSYVSGMHWNNRCESWKQWTKVVLTVLVLLWQRQRTISGIWTLKPPLLCAYLEIQSNSNPPLLWAAEMVASNGDVSYGRYRPQTPVSGSILATCLWRFEAVLALLYVIFLTFLIWGNTTLSFPTQARGSRFWTNPFVCFRKT
jgi:hypothetical protein